MTKHVPILVEPIVNALIEPFKALSKPAWLIDCTFGGGGHTAALLAALSSDALLSKHRILAIDQDQHAVDKGAIRFQQSIDEQRLVIKRARMSELPTIIDQLEVFGIMADLGFSSDQIEDPATGLSFQIDGPLDMRLDQRLPHTCYDVLSQLSQEELTQILFTYGEERYSRRIAGAITNARNQKQLPKTSLELAQLIRFAIPRDKHHGHLHPATRTFQALRIVVNQELEELDSLLKNAILYLRPGGRMAVLSFHSLEDRKVKQVFKNKKDSFWHFNPLSKKPILPNDEELLQNPRARSAKLRIAERRLET